MPNRAAWAEVDLGAYARNIEEIKKCIQPGARLCMVVKADAYGHGAVPCARVAVEHGASYLAVATIGEGIELRQAGFTQPILLLGLILPEEAATVVAYGITQTVATRELGKALSEAAAAQGKTAKVHLKVETGMGRIGVRPEEAAELAVYLHDLPHIELEGVFSHFAMADCEDQSYTETQLALFKQALSAIEARGIRIPIRHIAESAAILGIPQAHYDMVRCGIIQHGLWPSSEVGHPIELTQTMQLKARVVFLKTLHKGESIGYGRTFVAAHETRIATLPIGYADGYIRAYAAKGCVEINGHRAPICGRICMDQVMVDVTGIPQVHIGTVATLFGSPTLTTDEAASWIDTINYEVTSIISPRVPRVYLG
jgi:alanine racemase